jgi:hypothetical protein
MATNFFKKGRKDKTCIISRLPSSHISSFIKYFQYFWCYHWILFMCKICHIVSLFVAIATRIFNILLGRKAIYPYIKFHKNIFSTFCVIAGSSFVDGRTDGRTDERRVNLKSTPVNR